jgi:hypothetical protein
MVIIYYSCMLPFQLKDKNRHLLLCCIGSTFFILDAEILSFIFLDCFKSHERFSNFEVGKHLDGQYNHISYRKNNQNSLRKIHLRQLLWDWGGFSLYCHIYPTKDHHHSLTHQIFFEQLL